MNNGEVCGPDGCEVDPDFLILQKRVNAMDEVAKKKLTDWLYRMGWYDSDMPGSNTREQGV